ncbi:hypothetical protein STENM36S_03525 [Streptomyces tendae]
MRRAPPLLHLGVDRAGDLVAGEEFGRAPVVVRVVVPAVALRLRLGVLLLEDVRDVVEHEPLALGVPQHPAVAAHRLGDQDALHRGGPDHARRVELHELHVQQRRPGQQRQGVTVAGVLPRVRRHLERLADAAGGDHHRGRLQHEEAAALALVAEDARDLAALLEHPGDRALLEDLQPGLVVPGLPEVLLLERDDLLLEGADQLQARAVADVGQARVLVAAEVALRDPAVRGAVEQRAPGLQFPHPLRGLLGVQLGHPPLVEELAAAHGVAEVDLPVVAGVDVAHGGGDAALGHHGVRLAEQRLADHGRTGAPLAGLDGGAQPGAARAHHDDVPLLPVDHGHQNNLGSSKAPDATRYT